MANERVPIYRSLFKTLKGNQGRVPAGMSGAYHRVVVGRRRRERNGPPMQPPHQPRQMYQPLDAPHLVRSASAPTGWTMPAGGHDMISSAPQLMVGNHTAVTQAARGHHGVASYLQLLNARYDLRLPRVSPFPA